MMKVAMMIFLSSVLPCLAAAQQKELYARYSIQGDTIQPDVTQGLWEDIPIIFLDDGGPEAESETGVSSLLQAGTDAFLRASAFSFSPVRFRPRGYESVQNTVSLNGIGINGLDNGFVPWGLWGGLNSVTRARRDVYGTHPSDFSVGGIGLNSDIDLRAGAQWTQTQVGYAISNRNYRHRLHFAKGSGFNHKGWAYSLAFSARYADKGYIPGTYYRGLSYYAALDKKWKNRSTLSLISFGAPTETGRQSASVQEAMDLAGTVFYNPSWGYQQGRKRNASIQESFQPVSLLVYELKPGLHSNWTTSLGHVSGKRKSSSFDWYNAPDPRPDYYKYLPGNYEISQPKQAAALRSLYRNNPDQLQINWERLYDVNRGNFTTIKDVNGEPGFAVSGKRSLYILSNRVTDQHRMMASTIYQSKPHRKIELTFGANYQIQINHYYQEVKDLLGGDFWVNINQFAERDFPKDKESMQYDLDRPNQVKKTGDPYGYNYQVHIMRSSAWTQAGFILSKFDLYLGGEISRYSFYRRGLNRNGLFPKASYGDAPQLDFLNYHFKGGITFKLNGRNYFFINGAGISRSPYFEDVYISPRTRNTVQENIKSETISTVQAGYRLQAPKARISLTGFYTGSRNGYDVLTFYHDQFQNFVNYALSGVGKIYFGSELGAEIRIIPGLSFNGAASAGRYYYNSRQHAVVTVDNSAAVIANQTVYMKNYRIPSTPHQAYHSGLFYRSPKFWFLNISANYFSDMWLSVNPLRRTAEALGGTDTDLNNFPEVVERVLSQERFKDQYTLDLFGGWSKRLPKMFDINSKPVYLVINLSVNNLLNNTQIRSGGYEQLRFDHENKNIDKFPPKYYYAYGLNYFASVTFRF